MDSGTISAAFAGSVAARHGLRRQYGSRWARRLSLIPVWLVLYPCIKLLERFGHWPRALSRLVSRMIQETAVYAPGRHDVMVCSYFKSGTNWTMQIVTQIAWRGRAEFDHIHDVVPWLELPDRLRYGVPLGDESTWRESPTGLRAVKTHLPFGKFEFVPEARYLWVVRDPKDAFVSGYRFIRSTVLGPLMPSVNKWLEATLSEDAYFGSWAEHLDSGWRRREHENVLFLTYEEMRSDLRSTVRRIAAFMGVELTDEEFERVVERSSYEYMKSHGSRFDTRGLSPPWAAPRGAMIRRGQARSAGELLSAADQERIDDYWRSELARLGSDFPYDEAFR